VKLGAPSAAALPPSGPITPSSDLSSTVADSTSIEWSVNKVCCRSSFHFTSALVALSGTTPWVSITRHRLLCCFTRVLRSRVTKTDRPYVTCVIPQCVVYVCYVILPLFPSPLATTSLERRPDLQVSLPFALLYILSQLSWTIYLEFFLLSFYYCVFFRTVCLQYHAALSE
jgi:hypothetical protein